MRKISQSKPKSIEELMPFDLKECLLDSPSFRAQLQSHENTLNSTAKKVKAIQKSIKGVIKSQQELNLSMLALSSSLKNFSYVEIGEMTEDESMIASSLFAYSNAFDETEKWRLELITSLEGHFKRMETDLKNKYTFLAEKKKKYEKEQSKMDKIAENFFRSPSQNDEIVHNVHSQRNLLNVAATDYVMTINLSHNYNRLGLYEIMYLIFAQFKLFYRLTRESIDQQEEIITSTQESLIKSTEKSNFDSQMAMADVLDAIKNPYFPGENGVLRGYLMTEEKKTGKKKLHFTAGIKRYFCKYDKFSCTLTRLDVSDNSSDKILVGCCRVNPSNIFSFDLYTDTSSEFSTYVALAEAEFKNWCDILAINKENKKESGSKNTLSHYSVEFVKKCISLIEKDSGVDFVGIYRIDGSQEKKLSLLELGSNPNTFDRFLKVVDTVCLADLTSSLKAYLRSLNPSLISRQEMTILRAVTEKCEEDQCLRFFRHVFRKIDQLKYSLSKLIFEHFHRVAKNSEVNMMTVENISVCIGPLLSQLDITNISQLAEMPLIFKVVNFCIRHCHEIFSPIPNSDSNVEHELNLFLINNS